MIYTLDTNVFVDALRQPAESHSLKGFLHWALPQTSCRRTIYCSRGSAVGPSSRVTQTLRAFANM